MKKTILTSAAIIIAFTSAFSQSVTETRQIKTTALQIYENYKVVMSELFSRNAYTEDNFMALFHDKAVLYNDIVPVNTPTKLSPAEYFAKFRPNIRRIYPTYSDFRMGEPVSVGNKWQIECNYVRSTRFRTQSDMRYPEWSFEYTITVEMDKRYNATNKVYENAKIVSIDVKNPLGKFFVIENNENISLGTKSWEALEGWDEEYNSRIFSEYEWKIGDIQTSQSHSSKNFFEYITSGFSQNQTDTHFYHPYFQKFSKNIFGIGLNYCPDVFAFGNQISDENNKNFDKIEYVSDALSLSIFYGVQIAHTKRSTLFFNFGLDLNKYSHNYSGEYGKRDTIDKRIEIVKIESLDERINIISVSVPLSIQYLYQLTEKAKNPIFLSFEAGAFVDRTLYSKRTDNTNLNYQGWFDYYKATEDKPDWEVEFTYEKKQELPLRLDYGFFGGTGLWFAMNNNNLLKFGILYKQSFNPPLEHKEDYKIFENSHSCKSLLHSRKHGLRNVSVGISWITTIRGKK